MAYIQYLKFDDLNLPLPNSYDVDLSSVEADLSGETEAGTTQRDVIRAGVVSISVRIFLQRHRKSEETMRKVRIVWECTDLILKPRVEPSLLER